MNQRIIAIVVIIAEVFLAGLVYSFQQDAAVHATMYMYETGTCFLDDGTCLHAELASPKFILGYILAAALVLLGVYLLVFDKTQQIVEQHQRDIAAVYNEAKQRDSFEAFLKGFSPEEQAALKAIHAQEGILQSTLRYKLDKSKAYVSEIITTLEGKGAVSREKAGKTYKLYVKV